MHRHVRLACTVFAGVLLTPSASFCNSYIFPDPSANVVWTGKTVVVAYDAKGEVGVQAYDVTNGRVRWSKRLPAATLVLAKDICVEHGLVYVATGNQGVYVLDSATGSIRTRLQPRTPVADRWPFLACARNRVLVGYLGENWLVAYNTQNLRPVWKRLLGDSKVFGIAARGNEFTVLALNLSRRELWERIVLRSANGQFVAKRPATDPYNAVPEHLPKAVQKWYGKTVGGASVVGPSAGQRGGRLWFVGAPAGSYGEIYAVRDDGHVAWTKPVKGLSSVALAHDRLIAAVVHYNYDPGEVWPGWAELLALDPTTGRQLWAVKLDSFPLLETLPPLKKSP